MDTNTSTNTDHKDSVGAGMNASAQCSNRTEHSHNTCAVCTAPTTGYNVLCDTHEWDFQNSHYR